MFLKVLVFTTLVAVGAFASCGCNVGLFEYEMAGNGNTCWGGCGGGGFEFHYNGTVVSKLDVWTPSSTVFGKITGLQVTFANGKALQAGKSDVAHKSFSFGTNERITSFIISENAVGSLAGYINFVTDQGRKFEMGDPNQTKRVLNIGSGILVGAVGRRGDDVDALNFMFVKPIDHSQISNVVYPDLHSLTTGLKPVVLQPINICNNNEEPTKETLTFTETVGEKDCWSQSTTQSFEIAVGVSAGIPEVFEAGGEFKWGMSTTRSFQKCTDTTKKVSASVDVIAPKRSRLHGSVSQFDSPVTLRYTGDLDVYFKDKSQYRFATAGTYSGVFLMNRTIVTNERKLGRHEKC